MYFQITSIVILILVSSFFEGNHRLCDSHCAFKLLQQTVTQTPGVAASVLVFVYTATNKNSLRGKLNCGGSLWMYMTNQLLIIENPYWFIHDRSRVKIVRLELRPLTTVLGGWLEEKEEQFRGDIPLTFLALTAALADNQCMLEQFLLILKKTGEKKVMKWIFAICITIFKKRC